MGLLKPLTMDVSHLKMGADGPTGSGKTTTGALIAIGLHRYLKLKGPVAFYDTERGSGFTKALFDKAGIDLVGVRSRSFKDLVTFMREAESIDAIALIDSITHPWREIMESWLKKNHRRKIPMHAWGDIKGQWAEGFSIPFVNNRLHIIMLGRQGDVFEDIAEEDDSPAGKKEFKPVKVGTKMQAEKETAYEPNVLLQLERVYTGHSGEISRIAHVIKDRSFKLDGLSKEFSMPRDKNGAPDIDRLIEENIPFAFIKPHVDCLDIKGTGEGISKSSSADMFDDEGNSEWARKRQERQLRLDAIKDLMEKYWPDRTKISKKAVGDVLEGATWGMKQRTRSWSHVEQKFKPEDVILLHFIMETLLSKENREALTAALGSGVENDTIVDPDAAAAAVKDLAEKVMVAGQATGETGNDLPF